MSVEGTRRFALVLCVGIAIVLAGCSSASSQLVGTWKGEIIPPAAEKKTDDFGDKLGNAFKGFLNSMLGPMTIEFNADGKYKVSMSVASETGTYNVSGNEVTLSPDDKDPNRRSKINIGKLVLSSDGKSLHTVKEFSSDSDLTLKKLDPSAK